MLVIDDFAAALEFATTLGHDTVAEPAATRVAAGAAS
jgi:hypothetical protein